MCATAWLVENPSPQDTAHVFSINGVAYTLTRVFRLWSWLTWKNVRACALLAYLHTNWVQARVHGLLVDQTITDGARNRSSFQSIKKRSA